MGQLDLLADYEALQQQKELDDAALAKERQMQETILEIKKKFGGKSFDEITPFDTASFKLFTIGGNLCGSVLNPQ